MPTWNELFTKEENRWKIPHERVVELVNRIREQKGARILDLGCGTGRHLIYLSQQGFSPFGMDISVNGLRYSQEWLSREKLQAPLTRADMTSLPYADSSFDALISILTIYHNPIAKIRQSLDEVYRVLRPGGLAVISFQSKRGFRYGKGKSIEPDTFLPDIGEDAGVPHHYTDLDELARELKKFLVWKVEFRETRNAEGNRSSHYEVLIEKE